MPILDPKIECMPQDEQRKMQFKLLKHTLEVAYKRSPFYQRKFKKAKITPDNFKKLEDIAYFPLTTKEELLNYNDDFLTKPKNEMVKVFSSGGTTSKGKLIYLDEEGLDAYLKPVMRGIYSCGIIPKKDIVAVLFNFGITAAGYIYGMLGLDRLKTLIVPLNQSLEPEIIVRYLNEIKPTTFYTSSAFLYNFTEEIKKKQCPIKFKVQKILAGGTALPNKLRKSLEEFWRAEIFEGYGTTEASRAGIECEYHNGMHTYPDYVYIEILDERTKKPLKNEGRGEVVFTILQRDCMPLIRYQINDLAGFTYKPCDCGRTTMRFLPPIDRLETRVTFKGFFKLYGYQIDQVISQFPGLSYNWRLIIGERKNHDFFVLQIESKSKIDKLKKSLEKALVYSSESIARGIKSGAILPPKVELIDLNTLPRNDLGKVKDRIIDKRKIKFY